jgi:hypothetical protein
MADHPRCPICRSRLDLEHLATDEAQDALLQYIYRLPQPLRLALVPYLGCWRSDQRDLAPERALRLAQEARALEPNDAILAAACSAATEGLRAKWQEQRARKHLTDHRYLLSCLDTARARHAAGQLAPDPAPGPAIAPGSRTAQGLAVLHARRDG